MPIKWTEDQRLVLHILHRDFSFDEATLAALYNHIFAEYLKIHGASRAVTSDVLSSQYGDRHRTTRSHLWESVLREPCSEADRLRRDNVHERIVDAARTLGIETVSGALPSKVPGGLISDEVDTLTSQSKSPAMKLRNKARNSKENRPGSSNSFPAKGGPGTEKAKDVQTRKVRRQEPNPSIYILPSNHARTLSRNVASDIVPPGSQEHATRDIRIMKKKEIMITQISQSPVSSPSIQLEMVHHSSIKWNEELPTLDTLHETFIDKKLPVYSYGGQVHRISVPNGRILDFMICHPMICNTCGETVDAEAQNQSHGLPFVHCSDTIRKDDVTIFTPAPKGHGSIAKHSYLRKVRFESHSGPISCAVRICDYFKCVVCSGSEHVRVQENAGLAKLEELGK